MAVVYIALGSNLGKRMATLKLARKQMAELDNLVIIDESPYYETEPQGASDQPHFINSVLCLRTNLTPRELLHELQGIERKLGRQRGKRWGPRTIDLDILFYDDIVVEEEGLEIPHPRMHERRFVLEPLCDIAPELIDPLFKKTIKELLKGLNGVKKN
ncbi:MAG TPA: 2-amino-4-hydroxy-6-hydroxymethyldihydropteridine diphosphokinase [Candidatus Hypogeohydataceae bacterium YC41]